MCYILFCPYLPQKKNDRNVFIQSLSKFPLGSHLCDVTPALWVTCQFLFCGTKKINRDFFSGWKKFFFFLFLQLKFNSLFFLLILYHTFHFSCKNFEIRTVRFLEINSLIWRNEFSRLSWLFIAVIVVILKRTGIITTNVLIALVVLGNPPVLHAAAGPTPSGF